MTRTKIPWTRGDDGSAGFTWNPATGCTAQCTYCYARRMAKRLKAMNSPRYANGFAPTFHPEALSEPLHWRKPRRVFVCSMGDLFDPAITDEQIAAVFGIMAACPQHTFQVLTKRAERMQSLFARMVTGRATKWGEHAGQCLPDIAWMEEALFRDDVRRSGLSAGSRVSQWPLPNVVLMVTVEDQAAADKRIPDLLATPAAVRGVSLEPLLGPVDISPWLHRGVDAARPGDADYDALNWVIVGADSTRGAPEMPEDWVRDLRDQCVAAGVPYFYKQRIVGGKRIELPELDGRQWKEFPEVRA